MARVWAWLALILAVTIFWWAMPVGRWLEVLASTIDSAPVASIGLFCLAYVLGALALAPAIPFAMAGGWLFGIEMGFVIVFAIGMVADTIPFLLARRLGPDGLHRIATGERARSALAALGRHSESRGFVLVLLVRWFPLAPFNLMNYLLGFTRVKTRDYLWATALACAPTTLLCVYAGAVVPGPGSAAGSPLMSAALIVLGMASVLGLSHFAKSALLGSARAA